MLAEECTVLYGRIFPFWDKLSDDERQLICGGTRAAEYCKGENVHGGSGECTGAVIFRSGCLRVYLLSENGKEITLYRLYPGEVCILSASCVLRAITFDVFVDAEEDSSCFLLNGKIFEQAAQQNLYIENFALNAAAERFSDVMWVMQQILFMRFDQRLAVFLSEEMNRTGNPVIQLTHEQIARYMGSAREVVSRMLKYFSAEGIVALRRGGIEILDKKRLRDLAV